MRYIVLALPMMLAACGPKAPVVEEDRTVAQYRCADGSQLTARFDLSDGSVMVLRGVTRLATLKQEPAASGISYRGEGHELRGKGDDVTFTAPGAEPLSCRAELP